MRQGIRHWLAPAIAAIALFVALGGSVYAAKKAKIDGRGDPGQVDPRQPGEATLDRGQPAQAGVLRGAAAGGPLTGVDINELTLGQVPSAAHADTADSAWSAIDAQTALNAVNAVDAQTVNGYGAGCLPATRPFAGACWESAASSAATAPGAARKCAARGGSLPEALQLAAFAEEPGVNLDAGDEWSGDIPVVSGSDVYAVVTVAANSTVDSDLSTTTHAYRCVIPLLK
jgi:hypothetical protein